MKWKCSDLKCVQKPTRGRLSLTHLPVQPLSMVWVRVISPVEKEKVYGGKDLLKSHVLSSEWNSERVRDDASGDSGEGEDDELPCVIGERAGDCVWRGSRRSVGSSFHRHGAAYLKERLVVYWTVHSYKHTAVLTVLGVGFRHVGPISLSVDVFVFICV